MSVAPRTPRPDARDVVLARALAVGRRRRYPWAVAAAAVILAAGAAAWLGTSLARERRAAALLTARVQALQDTIGILRSPGTRVVQIPVSTNGQVGSVTIYADSVTHRWLVSCYHLAPNQPGEAYQLWFVTTQGMTSAALMPMTTPEPMIVGLETPRGAGAVTGAAMSIEPAGGSRAPTGPMVFHLTL